MILSWNAVSTSLAHYGPFQTATLRFGSPCVIGGTGDHTVKPCEACKLPAECPVIVEMMVADDYI
jgi:hypothetical protein